MGQSVKPVPGTSPTLLRSMKSISWKRQKFAVKCTLLPPTHRPYITLGCSAAFSTSVWRKVTGWRLGLFVSAWLMKTSTSLCVKSASVRYGPCSKTTTRKPLVESSLASTPPAAPDPMITKSTSSDGLYVTLAWVICFPIPARLAATQDSLCRRTQRAAKNCARGRAQSLSSPHNLDCRRPPGPPGIPPACETAAARQSSCPLCRPSCRPGVLRIAIPVPILRGAFPADQASQRKIVPLQETSRRSFGEDRRDPVRTRASRPWQRFSGRDQ